jgi:hypothetical protein
VGKCSSRDPLTLAGWCLGLFTAVAHALLIVIAFGSIGMSIASGKLLAYPASLCRVADTLNQCLRPLLQTWSMATTANNIKPIKLRTSAARLTRPLIANVRGPSAAIGGYASHVIAVFLVTGSKQTNVTLH